MGIFLRIAPARFLAASVLLPALVLLPRASAAQYTGADGDFTFYADDGETYDYEQGVFATISIHWNEATHRLIIGPRKGSYPGMPQTFPVAVVFVRKGTGVGFEQGKFAPRELIPYDGRMVEVTLSENLSPGER